MTFSLTKTIRPAGALSAVVLLLLSCTPPTAPYPPSENIAGIEFDLSTIVEAAPGSDNWVVTWGNDDHQYVSWGDGGGFGGTNNIGRVSMGIGRIEGEFPDFKPVNVWGGVNASAPASFGGKSYGILSVGDRLWMWRTGSRSNVSAFEIQDLYYSGDNGVSWTKTEVEFTSDSFDNGKGFFAPTFLQFGPGYQQARDAYVYTYAPEIQSGDWDVQHPGQVTLLRSPASEMGRLAEYEYFSGMGADGTPRWSKDLNDRKPVFQDSTNGVMRLSVTYNKGLERYMMIVQQGSRLKRNGLIGIYDAPEPWGPWTTILLDSPWKLGLQRESKSVFWNFSNKWTSDDGMYTVLIYTGRGADNLGMVASRFILR